MQESDSLVFLSDGGGVGALMRAKDWSVSPLGRPRDWPQSLRSVVGLLLNSKFPMFVAWGAELGFLYNDAYAEILGGKHPGALGSRFEDIWREIWPDIHPIIEKALAGEATFHTNMPLTMNRRGYVEEAWFTFSYSPVRDESGAIAGMYCAVNETTSDVLNKRHRLEESERLHRLFAQAPGIMAVVSGPRHVFELANAAYRELVGHREVLGRPVREALSDLAGQGFFELLDQVYASGEPYRGHALPVRFDRGDGRTEEVFLNFVYQPIKDATGAVTGIFVEGHDVTAAIRANDELRRASQRKDEFLAMLAHELRNPLAPISAAADLLAMAGSKPEVVHQTSGIIARQVAHMTGLVDDLLDVSRVTRGLVTLHLQPLEVSSVVADAVEQVRGLFQSRQQHLALHLPTQATVVNGDRTRLVQVFANMLNNAAKYTPPGGHVDVRVDADAQWVRFSVQDDGVGIAPGLLPHVFDLFTQGERSPDRSQGGLGLGLALVRSLVELQGGRVAADSAGLGRGSRFTVSLPGATAAVVPIDADAAGGRASLPDPASLDILVVDDNVDAAKALCLLLDAMGHRVAVMHDARGAIDYARQARPRILFLDIGLPDMDGFELARRLRAMPEAADAMLVAVTGYGRAADKERARQAGFDRHMTKPVKVAALVELIADCVGQGQPA